MTSGPTNTLVDVAGLTVGHADDARIATGVTVVLPAERAVAAVVCSGGGPGTRETDALKPDTLVDAVDAIVLAGGSSYGLDAAGAVAAWLGARGRGFRLGAASIAAPVVPAAILFDLANGGDKDWGEEPPYRALGRTAVAAAKDGPVALGTVGAGYGAQCGRYKGGIGSASVVTGDGITVAALAAVNAFGAPTIPGTDCFWAWPFERGGEFGGRRPPPDAALPADPFADTKAAGLKTNTTIAVIATDATLAPAEAQRVAVMAHDGLARAVRPAHTPMDGDTVFALATGQQALPAPSYLGVARIGAHAADCLARAIARGVYAATAIAGLPAYRDQHPPP